MTIVGTDDYRGLTRLVDVDWEESETAFSEASALYALAGEIAVEILTKTPIDWDEWLGVEGADIESYQEVASRSCWYVMDGDVADFTPVLEEKAIEVRALLVERWAAVEAVAAALLRDGDVSGVEALRIMAETDVPGPVATVWADVLEDRRREAKMRERFGGAE